MRLRCLAVLACVWMMVANAGASGPRYVSGLPFFTGQGGLPVGWKGPQLLYYTDTGDLSASVNHAAADALVAAAANTWNVPVARLTVARGGSLAEHVSGRNTYLDATGLVWPADVMKGNAAAVPLAIVYDSDGSVTDTLLGSGASAPTACKSNAVTETVDLFDPADYIAHAIIVINGRCTGAAPEKQLELQYKLTRIFGRVLGLAWSQANDNVFTGVPAATYAQALNWPIMHPIDILCGLYAYQCLPNPFTLRPDDIAGMVLVYPNKDAATLPAGKQLSLGNANAVVGQVTFPNGAGMSDVNVLVRRQPLNGAATEPWVESSGVTGANYLRSAAAFTTPGTDALSSMGGAGAYFAGQYVVPYVPLPAGAVGDTLVISTEPLNPLYVKGLSVGPYGAGNVSPSGAAAVTRQVPGVGAGETVVTNFAASGGPSVCNDGLDGTNFTATQVDASGWWGSSLCPHGHASYVQFDVRPGRTFTVEATALGEDGLATTAKAMPVLGLFGQWDGPYGVPSVGSAATAFQGKAAATTAISGRTGSWSPMRLGVGDQRNEGRPDFLYQGRVFYADMVEPEQVAATGGMITIRGLGFRQGNAVLVNGVEATVLEWGASSLRAKVPALADSGAAAGTAVDVQVLDRGTGATSTMTGVLKYLPAGVAAGNAMVLVSAPAGGLIVGDATSVPFAVRLVAGDGVTPVAGMAVTFTASGPSGNDAVRFGACGATSCVMTTDAGGYATSSVSPLTAGSLTLRAQAGALTQSATVTGMARPASMILLNAPSGSFPVGDLVNSIFAVRVLDADGHAVVGLPVLLSVPTGNATYSKCASAVCTFVSDGGGAAGSAMTPTSAGTVTMRASCGGVTFEASFTATSTAETLVLESGPNATEYVNTYTHPFSVRLVRADGTAEASKIISFSIDGGLLFASCSTNPCNLPTVGTGRAGTNLLASKTGDFTLRAQYGDSFVTAPLHVVGRTQSMRIVSAPAVPIVVGGRGSFSAQLLDFDGSPMKGTQISMAAPADAFTLDCNTGACPVSTGDDGIASVGFTARRVGTFTLNAVYGVLTATATVTVVAAADVLQVMVQPASGSVSVGEVQTFTLRLLQPDGVTPDAGKSISFSVLGGSFSLRDCAGATCGGVTDAQGLVTFHGTATAAGTVSLQGAYGTVTVALTLTATRMPDGLQLVSAPAGQVWTQETAAILFVARAVLADGVTPDPGQTVKLSASAGSARLEACGLSACDLVSDANGLVASGVTPLDAGSVGLKAVLGAAEVNAAFTAQNRPDTLQVVQVPAGPAYVGDIAQPGFAVKLQSFAGAAVAGRAVSFVVAGGSASVIECSALPCVLNTDSGGQAEVHVTPLAAGTIRLEASTGGLVQTASFAALEKANVLLLVTAPEDGAWVGEDTAKPFRVRLVKSDGVTPVAGGSIALSSPDATFAACASLPCLVTGDAGGYAGSAVTPLHDGTIALTASAGALVQSAHFKAVTRPDVLQVESVPADGSLAGDETAQKFMVRLTGFDGTTPRAGQMLDVRVSNGTLTACASAACRLTTDAQGRVSTGVTPAAAGAVELSASKDQLAVTARFSAVAKPDRMGLVSAPADGALVGDEAAVPFAVRVTAADGVTGRAGVPVVLAAAQGVLTACGAQSCTLLSDAYGQVSTGVIPDAAGVVQLSATRETLQILASFRAVAKPDRMGLVSAPADGALVGDEAAVPFAVRVTAADGVTGRAGVPVVLTAAQGVLTACGAQSCTLLSDAFGQVSTAVTPGAAGVVQLSATRETLQILVSFRAVAKPDRMRLVSAPADGALVGDEAEVPLAVVLTGFDGKEPRANQSVILRVTNGTLTACQAVACTVLTDAQGHASSSVVPGAAGIVQLSASKDGLEVSASFRAQEKPEILRLISQPAEGATVGDTAASQWRVQVLAGDGGKPRAGRSVTLRISGGAASLTACGTSLCVLTTDADGYAATDVVPLGAGRIALEAAYGGQTVTAEFTAVDKPDRMELVSAPADGALVGDAAATSFVVRVLRADGSPRFGTVVTLALTRGAAALEACGGGTECQLTTDAGGLAQSRVTPLAAGQISLSAKTGELALAASFMAVEKPDVLRLLGSPADGALVGDTAAAAMRVQVMRADGVTPRAGVQVTMTVQEGLASLTACASARCVVTTGADGVASSGVTPAQAGVIRLEAKMTGASVTASFSAVDKPDVLILVSVPEDGALVGDEAAAPLAVRVTRADGKAHAGVAVTLAAAGGDALLTACGAASCAMRADADGRVSSGVKPGVAGDIVLRANGAGKVVQVSFTAKARQPVLALRAVGGTAYLAEGAMQGLTLGVMLTRDGAAAEGAAIAWTGGAGVRVAGPGSTTDAQGLATMYAVFGPLAAGQTAEVTACASGMVCARFAAVGISGNDLRVAVSDGGAQDGPALVPVRLMITDSAGDAVAGAAVSVSQTVRGLGVECPASGRCPAQPVLDSSTAVTVTGSDGSVWVSPLVVAGVATQTAMLATTGSSGYATTMLTRRP